MIRLSVEEINKTAPYKVTEGSQGFVDFITDHGVAYSVGFVFADILQCADTFQFYITNTNNKKSPRDPKLKDTIMAVVVEFFKSNNLAMLYICDTGDGKQAMRNRLFKYWITESIYYDKVNTVSGCVTDEEGIKNFASLVIRFDHPQMEEVVMEFLGTINLLNNKPTH